MRTKLVIALLGSLLMLPCASYANEGFPRTAGPAPQSWNIGAGDLLDYSTASCRLRVYLDELTTLGGPKQIRIIYTPSTGPFILEHWFPVIRAKGFRVLVILYQGWQDTNLEHQRTWIAAGLTPIVDILDGVHLANEVNRKAYNDMGPHTYGRWHRQVAQWVRAAVPGVPILSPDFHDPGSKKYVRNTGLAYGVDFNIYSLHTTGYDAKKRWKWARDHSGTANPRVWITEGHPHHLEKINNDILPPRTERLYTYVWNCNPDHPGQDGCSAQMRRPAGEDVPQCDVP